MSDVVILETCPVCASAGIERVRDVPGRWIGGDVFEPFRGRLGLCRCRQCALIFVNPRPAPALLERFYGGEQYVCHAVDETSALRAKADHVLSRIEHYQPQRGTLLDFGCGSGWMLARARERGWEALGYDVGGRALSRCRDRQLRVVAALEEIDDASVDAIVMHHVLEHLEDFEVLFGALRRILRPHGRLCVEVPNVRSLRARISPAVFSRHLSFDERYRAFPIHLSYFSPMNLSVLLARHGFSVRGVETYGLGIDELRWRPEAEHTAYCPVPETAQKRRSRLQPFKTLVKRAIYGLALGENLFVAAGPAGAADARSQAPRAGYEAVPA